MIFVFHGPPTPASPKSLDLPYGKGNLVWNPQLIDKTVTGETPT